jgi:hypothetical protein
MENKYLEIDNSDFESKKNTLRWEKRREEIIKNLKEFLKQQGYRLIKDSMDDDRYLISEGFFSFSKAKLKLKMPELSFSINNKYNHIDYYITVYVKNKNLRLIKQLFDDFSRENKIRVRIDIEWSDYDLDNKEEESK